MAHSLSPALHDAAYRALGLVGWRYDAIEADADGCGAVVGRLDGTWAGLSVTMPLKQVVMTLLDDVSPLARDVGAVNTVVVQDGVAGPATNGAARSRVRLRGENTDVHGLVAAFGEAGVTGVTRACVVGAGATAASALAALRELGCRTPAVHLRSAARAGELLDASRRLGVDVVLTGWTDLDALLAADVVISTVPAGAADGLAGIVAGSARRPQGTLLDVVYDPWPTELAVAWSTAGGTVVDGLAMLLHQAAAQVELFTGLDAPLEAMRAAVRGRRR